MDSLKDISKFIFLEDQPEEADAIIIPGNTWPEPSIRAAALYKEGFAPYVIPSGRFSKEKGFFPGPSSLQERFNGDYETEADFLKDVLMQEGLPEEAIICDREATFTLENALNARKLLKDRNIKAKKLIICCQAFHARRCRMYFEYAFRDEEIRLILCPAVTQGISKENWTETENGLQTVLGELMRCGQQFGWMLHK